MRSYREPKTAPSHDRALANPLPTLRGATPRIGFADKAHRRRATSDRLASGREFFFAPCQGSIERAGMNRNSKMAPDRLGQGFAPLYILSSLPALDEVEDLLGALV